MPNNEPMQQRCSLCKRVITIRDQYDMPIYDPQSGFGICKNCIREINHFLDDHDHAEQAEQNQDFALTPRDASLPDIWLAEAGEPLIKPVILSNSFAFGGNNASILIGRPS